MRVSVYNKTYIIHNTLSVKVWKLYFYFVCSVFALISRGPLFSQHYNIRCFWGHFRLVLIPQTTNLLLTTFSISRSSHLRWNVSYFLWTISNVNMTVTLTFTYRCCLYRKVRTRYPFTRHQVSSLTIRLSVVAGISFSHSIWVLFL